MLHDGCCAVQYSLCPVYPSVVLRNGLLALFADLFVVGSEDVQHVLAVISSFVHILIVFSQKNVTQ